MDYLYFVSQQYEETPSAYAFTLYAPTPEFELAMLNTYLYYYSKCLGAGVFIIHRVPVDGHCIEMTSVDVTELNDECVSYTCHPDWAEIPVGIADAQNQPFSMELVSDLDEEDQETYRLMTEGNTEDKFSREDWAMMMQEVFPERFTEFYNRCLVLKPVVVSGKKVNTVKVVPIPDDQVEYYSLTCACDIMSAFYEKNIVFWKDDGYSGTLNFGFPSCPPGRFEQVSAAVIDAVKYMIPGVFEFVVGKDENEALMISLVKRTAHDFTSHIVLVENNMSKEEWVNRTKLRYDELCAKKKELAPQQPKE